MPTASHPECRNGPSRRTLRTLISGLSLRQIYHPSHAKAREDLFTGRLLEGDLYTGSVYWKPCPLECIARHQPRPLPFFRSRHSARLKTKLRLNMPVFMISKRGHTAVNLGSYLLLTNDANALICQTMTRILTSRGRTLTFVMLVCSCH